MSLKPFIGAFFSFATKYNQDGENQVTSLSLSNIDGQFKFSLKGIIKKKEKVRGRKRDRK